MRLAIWDVAAIAAYFVALLYLAYLTRRTKSFEDFAVGRHSVPTMMVFASMAATIMGPGFSVGFTAKGWETGYLFYYLALAYGVQVVLVGLYLAPRLTQQRDCRSIGDVMGKKYGAASQFLTGIVSVGLCVGFTAVMAKVGGAILHALSGWPIELCYLIVTGVTTLITFSGGVRATIATEALQFSLKSVVVSGMLLIAIFQNPAGLSATSELASDLTRQGFESMTGWQIFGIALSFMLGEALIPPYANRALAAKTEKASRTGFVAAGLFCAVWLAVVALLGVVAHGYLPADTPADDVFVALAQQVLPVGLFGLLLAALMAIVMASQEAVLNSGAVAFVRDIVGVWHSPTERGTLLVAKLATLVFALAAVVAAHFAPSIIDGLLILYSIWAPTILLPLVLGLYLERTRPMAGWLSIVAGGGASLIWQFALGEPHGIPAILVGLMAAALGYSIGHFAGSPKVPAAQGEAS